MAIHCIVREETGYVRIVSHGTVQTLDDITSYSEYVFEQAKALKSSRMLLDETAVTDDAEAATIYEWSEGDLVVEMVIAGLRIAVISVPENLAINHLYETMLRNRSCSFRVFVTEEDALKWLLS